MSNTLLMLAILPGILIIIYVYRMDKVEKEPWRLIFKLMVFGALSCIPASVMEMAIDSAMPAYPEGSLSYAVTMAFCSAAFCEELCKFAFLRFGTWKNPEFGYRFDGIVYGVAVAVGFAVLENIMYVGQYGLYTGIVRAVMAVPLHAFCGVFMGIFYGAAKQARIQGKGAGKFLLLALIVPMMIHGVYDTLAFLGNTAASVVLLAFVVLMYIVSIRYIRRFSRDDWKAGFYPDTQPLSAGQDQGGHQQPLSGRGGSGSAASQRRQAAAGYRAYPGQVQDGKIVLLCPHCGCGLRVPVGMGRIRVRCPHCGREFSQDT
ncbi:MAG: PrsW family intramembrane metalloprotease [Firmicutes bacterium]|nr:PrsW family intramembrane metalloprotease [Bacillota bacterium]